MADRYAATSTVCLCACRAPAIFGPESSWLMGMAVESTASASSARTKTIPAAEARRSHTLSVGPVITLGSFQNAGARQRRAAVIARASDAGEARLGDLAAAGAPCAEGDRPGAPRGPAAGAGDRRGAPP